LQLTLYSTSYPYPYTSQELRLIGFPRMPA
jgi:hypothetical protein